MLNNEIVIQGMVRQINLDRWQTDHLTDLLHRGSDASKRDGRPIEIYRRVLEEGNDCYEEVVCTLVQGYVIEQMVASGGPIPPSFTHQTVYDINEYSGILLKKSRERFRRITDMLESME